MRSIRRSLSIYVLVLFALAIAGVGVLVDRIVVDTLEFRREAVEVRIKDEFKLRCSEREDKINDTLQAQARLLAQEMNTEYLKKSNEENARFAPLTVAVGFGTAPLTTPLPLLSWTTLSLYPHATTDRGTFDRPNTFPAITGRLFRQHITNLNIDPHFVAQIEHEVSSDDSPHYFQINSVFGSVWRSRSLDDTSLPFDIRQYEGPKMNFWQMRPEPAVPLPDGRVVRRVVLKTPVGVPSFRYPYPRRNDRDRPPPGGAPSTGGSATRGGPPGPRPVAPATGPTPAPADPTPQLIEQTPRIYVMAARLNRPDEVEYADLIEWRDNELLAEANESHRILTRVRGALFGIGLLGFVAVAAGGPLLVRRGLSPVNQLSDAVSQVSAKDFHLSVERGDLSHELLPIHDRLSHTLLELQRAFEREKQAVADISHELRTPVAALLTTIDVTLRKPRTADHYKGTLEECRAITKQLGQLVERVMTIAYLDAGQTTMSRTTVEAGELAEGCGTIIRPLAEAHGLSFRILAEPVELKTDKDKLREVLMNLLHNAVEYTNPGGSIELAVRPVADNKVAFDVTDTGIGMSDEVKARIFERFYRADPSRTATGVHAGLGLSIVKEYVDRLGGSIRVESSPGKGTTFHLELPA